MVPGTGGIVEVTHVGGAGAAQRLYRVKQLTAADLVPVAGFSGNPRVGAAPLAVTFTDTSSGWVTNRFWEFGDGTTTNTSGASVTHVYA